VPNFSYRALTAEGERVEGLIEAGDEKAAIARLQAQGLMPIEASAAAPPAASEGRRGASAGGGGPALTSATRELATLIEAGEPLESALAMLVEDAGDRRIAGCFARLLERVRGGEALSAAMAAEPATFPRFYVGMVRAGEATGRLEAALMELASLREKREALTRKLTSALIYPGILVLTAIVSIGLMLGVVVPQFAPLFAGEEVALPASTRFILALSETVRASGELWAAAILLMALALILLARVEPLRLAFDGLVLRLPFLGRTARERATAEVARGLATLLRGGLDLPAALTLLREMVGNRAVARALEEVVTAVRQGRRLADALAERDVLVPMGLRLLRTGEESGRLAVMARHVADQFEERLATRLTRLVGLIEPLLVVALGIIVGGIVLSILTAVLSVNELAL